MSASQINPRVALVILYKGLTVAHLSIINEKEAKIRLPELTSAIDLVFSNKELYSQLNIASINGFINENSRTVAELAKKVEELYVYSYRGMDNINMVWNTLGEAYNTLMVMGSYFGLIYLGEVNKLENKLMCVSASLTSSVLAILLDERVYSVKRGLRSGLDQLNTIKHPNYKQLLKVKTTFDKEHKKIFPDFTPMK